MFFIMGVSRTQKTIELDQTLDCPKCREERLMLIFEYSYLMLFFIPIIKWNKKYYLMCNGCERVYILDVTMGNQIVKGKRIELDFNELEIIEDGLKTCLKCGYQTKEDFTYCPKCASHL